MTLEPIIAPAEKTEIKKDFYQYFFDHEPQPNSIFVCLDRGRGKALVIDTISPGPSAYVKKDLESQDIDVETVVLTHFHPDHVAGCPVFTGSRIYASRHYEYNFENCKRWEPKYDYQRPTDLLKDGDKMSFGPFSLDFAEAHGHSQCGFIIKIDNDIVIAGDLLMYGHDGRPTLPYISLGGGFSDFIQCLERLKAMEYRVLLVPHGKPMSEKKKIADDIDDAVYYLKRTLNSKGTLPLNVCLKKDPSHYGGTEYHDNNLIQLMMA